MHIASLALNGTSQDHDLDKYHVLRITARLWQRTPKKVFSTALCLHLQDEQKEKCKCFFKFSNKTSLFVIYCRFFSSKLSKSAINPILNHDQTYHPSFITRTKEKYKCFVLNFRQSMMLISLSGSIWWSIHIAGDILTGGVGPAQKHGILQAWISDYKSVFVISEWDSRYQFKLEYTTGLSAPGKIISSSPFCACLLVHNVCGSSK